MPRHIISTGSQAISGDLTISGNLFADNVVYTGQTGSFYPTSNPSGYITGIDLSNYITTGQTGAFYPTATNPSGYVTGSVIRPTDTGAFYPRTNPSGYITGVNLSSYITTGQTGSFYPTSNPSGYLTGEIGPSQLTENGFAWNLSALTYTASDANTQIGVTSSSASALRTPLVSISCFNSGFSGYGIFQTRTARGTSTSPLSVNSGEVIGQIRFTAYGGTGYRFGAYFAAQAKENFSDTEGGTAVAFFNSRLGSISPLETMRLSEQGAVLIGTTTDISSSILTINSTTRGVRLPIMTTAQRTGVANTAGLILYDSSLSKLYASSASTWLEQVDISSTQTLTNKRVTARISSVASSATPTINTDNCDIFKITLLATNITSMTTNLSGTPQDGDQLLIRIKDNGVARTITWGASFQAMGAALPTTTVISKTLHVQLLWDSVENKWGCIATSQQA